MKRDGKKIVDVGKGEAGKPGDLVKLGQRTGLAHYARLCGGKRGLIEMARFSKHAKVVQVVALWDGMSADGRRRFPLEDLCLQVGIEPGRFLAETIASSYDFQMDLSGLILAHAQPKLTQRLVQLAMDPANAKHMEMALKAAGRFPINESQRFAFFGGQTFSRGNGPPQPPAPPAAGLPSAEADAIIDVDFEKVLPDGE